MRHIWLERYGSIFFKEINFVPIQNLWKKWGLNHQRVFKAKLQKTTTHSAHLHLPSPFSFNLSALPSNWPTFYLHLWSKLWPTNRPKSGLIQHPFGLLTLPFLPHKESPRVADFLCFPMPCWPHITLPCQATPHSLLPTLVSSCEVTNPYHPFPRLINYARKSSLALDLGL